MPRAGDGERTAPQAWRSGHRASDAREPGADGHRKDSARTVHAERGTEAVGTALCPDADCGDRAGVRGGAVAGVFAGRDGGAVVAAPEELRAPKHPSQVAFEALSPLTPSNCLPPGLWRRARAALARLRMGGGMVVGMPAVALCGRETGRLAARAEAAAQAPWQAAIAAACGLKRAMARTRGQTRDTRNDPIRGTGGQTPGVAQRPYTRRGRPNWGNVQRPYTRRRRAIPRGVAQRPYTRPLRARRCGGGRAGAAATRMRDTGAAPPSPLIRFAAQPLRSRTLVRSSRPKPAKSGRGKGVIQGLRPVFS